MASKRRQQDAPPREARSPKRLATSPDMRDHTTTPTIRDHAMTQVMRERLLREYGAITTTSILYPRESKERKDLLLKHSSALVIFDRLAAGAARLGNSLEEMEIELKFRNRERPFVVELIIGRIYISNGDGRIGDPIAWSPDILATRVRPVLRSWLESARGPDSDVVPSLERAESTFVVGELYMSVTITRASTELHIQRDGEYRFHSIAPFAPFFEGVRSKEKPGSVTACSVALERALQSGWVDGPLDDVEIVEDRATSMITETARGRLFLAHAIRPIDAAKYGPARTRSFALARRVMEAAGVETCAGNPWTVRAVLRRKLEGLGGTLGEDHWVTSVSDLDARERSGSWDVARLSVFSDEIEYAWAHVPRRIPWLDSLIE